MFPHVWKQFAEKMQEDYQQGIQEPNNQIRLPSMTTLYFRRSEVFARLNNKGFKIRYMILLPIDI